MEVQTDVKVQATPSMEMFASLECSISSHMATMQHSLTHIFDAVKDIQSNKATEPIPLDPRLLLSVLTELQYRESEKRLEQVEFMKSVVSFITYLYAYSLWVSILQLESAATFSKKCKVTLAAIVDRKFAGTIS